MGFDEQPEYEKLRNLLEFLNVDQIRLPPTPAMNQAIGQKN